MVTPDITLNELPGATDDFQVTSNSIFKTPDLSGMANNFESTQTETAGTAAGSVQLVGNFNSVTFEFTGVGIEGNGTDAIELIFSNICPVLDSDNDGVPDYQDIDSDNDGCPDAIEGAESIVFSQLIRNTIDYANQGGLDTDGVPNAVSAGGQGQGVGSSIDANLM